MTELHNAIHQYLQSFPTHRADLASMLARATQVFGVQVPASSDGDAQLLGAFSGKSGFLAGPVTAAAAAPAAGTDPLGELAVHGLVLRNLVEVGAVDSRHGVYFRPPGDADPAGRGLVEAIEQVPRVDGQYVLFGHPVFDGEGLAVGWWVGGHRVSVAQLAEVSPHLPGLRPLDELVLASCDAGSAGIGGVTELAARLSMVSGRSVIAASGYVRPERTGLVAKHPPLRPGSAGVASAGRPGRWWMFRPDGSRQDLGTYVLAQYSYPSSTVAAERPVVAGLRVAGRFGDGVRTLQTQLDAVTRDLASVRPPPDPPIEIARRAIAAGGDSADPALPPDATIATALAKLSDRRVCRADGQGPVAVPGRLLATPGPRW